MEEIFEEVKKKLPRITKATIYNNLRVLIENGHIREVNVKGVQRFEAKVNAHHHIICNKCGKIWDFDSNDLVNYSLRIIESNKDFIINSAETMFFGLCKGCKTE